MKYLFIAVLALTGCTVHSARPHHHYGNYHYDGYYHYSHPHRHRHW